MGWFPREEFDGARDAEGEEPGIYEFVDGEGVAFRSAVRGKAVRVLAGVVSPGYWRWAGIRGGPWPVGEKAPGDCVYRGEEGYTKKDQEKFTDPKTVTGDWICGLFRVRWGWWW